MACSVDVHELVDQLNHAVKDELSNVPEVVECGNDLDVTDLAVQARRWHKLKDLVCVVADLKSSTKLGIGKHDTSTARIYQASTGGVVDIFDQFDADFIQIQGDGVFALFWGESRSERAVCAGVTVKKFSESLVSQLENRWPDLPETGYKVGIAANRVLVKRVGTPRNPAQQEPIWAGKPVNYATKCAQSADRNQMIVTGAFWDRIQNNDYLAYSCPCGTGPSSNLWSNKEVEKLPAGDPDRQGRVLTSSWCDTHGKEYCDAILAGKTKRDDVGAARGEFENSLYGDTLWKAAQQTRRDREARRRGLGR